MCALGKEAAPGGVDHHSNLPQRKKKTATPAGWLSFFGAAGQIRTADLILTKDALYLLSYSSKVYAPHKREAYMATKKGLEPSTSGVTGRRSNRLNYLAIARII